MRNLPIIFLLFVVTTLIHAENLGQTTYQLACKNCHGPQLAKAINAPAAFNKEAWNLRFKQAKLEAKNKPEQFKTALDYLVYRVKIGKGLMYHGGLCNEVEPPNKNCSYEALSQAIQYMSQ